MAKHVSTNPQISWIWVELNRLFHLSSQHYTLSSMLVIKTAWVGLRNYGLAWILCFGRHNRRWRWCDFSWKIYTVSLARKTAANFCGLLKKKTPTFDATKTNGNIPSCPLKYPLEWVKLELVDGQMSGCGDADTVPSTSGRESQLSASEVNLICHVCLSALDVSTFGRKLFSREIQCTVQLLLYRAQKLNRHCAWTRRANSIWTTAGVKKKSCI